MKRRDLIKGAIYSAPLTLKVGDVFAQDDELVVGEDVLESYDPVSHDITEFDININRLSQTIYITPRNPEKPFLAVVSLHRYLQELMDDVYGSGDITILDRNPSIRVTDHYVIFENGWSVDHASMKFLYGGVHHAGTSLYQCSAQLIGRMDSRLVKDLYIVDNNGSRFYQDRGVFIIQTSDRHTTLTMKYLSYKNFAYTDDGVKRNTWTENVYETQFLTGVISLPIYTVG